MPVADDVIWLEVLPSMRGFGPALTKESGKASAAAGAASGRAYGKAMLAGAAVVAGGAVLATKALYNVGAMFDDMSDKIRVGTGASGEALDGLVTSAKNVGREVPASFDQIGTVVADLNTRLGLTGPTLEKLSSQFLEAGRILEEEIDVQSVTGAFSAFKIEGEATTDAMDALFQVSQATGVGINDLGSMMAKNGTIAAQLGLDFGETASFLGILDKAGVNSRAVMSSMNAGLAKLAKDGEKPADAFKRVTTELQGFIDSGDEAAAVNLAVEAFGSRGGGQMVSALRSGKLALDDLTGSAGLSGDGILEVANETADLSEEWQKFKNQALLAIEPVATRVFNALTVGMAWFNREGIPALKGFADGVRDNKTTLMILGGVLGTIVAGLLVYNTTVKVVTAVTKAWNIAQKLLNGTMRLNPLGLIVTALVAVGAAMVIAYKKSDTFRGVIQGILGFVKTHWKTIVSIIGGPIAAAIVHFDKIKAAARKVREIFGDVVGGIGTAWGKITGFIEKPIKAVIGVINRFIRAVNKIPGVNLPEIGWGEGKGSSKMGVVRAHGSTAFATGGAVRGSGTATSDSIPAWLSNGEHVLTAADVRNMGGQQRVYAMRAAAAAGQLHFAKGGAVVPGKGNRHSGYPWASWAGDFPNPIGTPVKAWKSGVIALVRTLAGSYGKHIRMNHNDGTSSLYAHLSRFGKFGRGDRVGQGATIGYVGSTGNSTGPHLHFESMGGAYKGGSGGGGSIWDKVTGSIKGFNSWFGGKISSLLGGALDGGILGDVGGMVRHIGGQIRDGVKSKLFDSGGWMMPGTGGFNASAQPEPVFTGKQWDVLSRSIYSSREMAVGRSSAAPSLTDLSPSTIDALAAAILDGALEVSGGVVARAGASSARYSRMERL